MGRSYAVTAICAFALASASPAFAAGCKLEQNRELKVAMEGLVPSVRTKINGADARLILDSGAFYSTLTTAAADRLGIRPQTGTSFEIVGFDGALISARAGRAREFELAGRSYKDIQFVLSGIGIGSRFDGLLGQNVLGYNDTEFDLANGVVRSFSATDCDGQLLAYWLKSDQPYGVIDIERLNAADIAQPHIIGRVLINGQSVRATFDTGASTSLLSLETARRLGLDLGGEGVQDAGATHSLGGGASETKSVPLASFQIDQEVIRNTRIEVVRSKLDTDMLIGADFFLAHRVYVAKSQRKLYFSYNGGPVFRLDEPAAPQSNPVASRPTIADADALERRALASLARTDYASAKADLDGAIALEPKQARLYYARARTWGAKERDRAIADLDEAIRLDPAYVDALVYRGHLELQAKQREAAEASFAAATKAAPAGTDLRLRLAESYQAADLFEPAVANLDAWITAHPKDGDMAEVLNQRCWSRALMGRDLEKALADCNEALKRGPRLAAVLDSRGMVHLRRGEFGAAISDYDAALKAQPNLAWSHLGRGLARLKIGDVAGGRADIAAAEKIEPSIRSEAESYGLVIPAAETAAKS